LHETSQGDALKKPGLIIPTPKVARGAEALQGRGDQFVGERTSGAIPRFGGNLRKDFEHEIWVLLPPTVLSMERKLDSPIRTIDSPRSKLFDQLVTTTMIIRVEGEQSVGEQPGIRTSPSRCFHGGEKAFTNRFFNVSSGG